ncbi:hypothetical protein HAX54_010623, partial [Datura stramonium]|nr:hypothetical protein [Datura stramonium]
ENERTHFLHDEGQDDLAQVGCSGAAPQPKRVSGNPGVGRGGPCGTSSITMNFDAMELVMEHSTRAMKNIVYRT